LNGEYTVAIFVRNRTAAIVPFILLPALPLEMMAADNPDKAGAGWPIILPGSKEKSRLISGKEAAREQEAPRSIVDTVGILITMPSGLQNTDTVSLRPTTPPERAIPDF
jgi:hypothetical protein